MTPPQATLSELLRDRAPFVPTEDRPWDAGLWADLAAAGLTGTGLPVEAGGSGGPFADAVALVRALAAAGASLPLAEQLLVAGPALLAADVALPPVAEPLTVAPADRVRAEPLDDGDGPGRYRLEGTADDVPWAGTAVHVAVLAAPPAGIGGAVLALADAPSATPSGRRDDGVPTGRLEFPGTSVPGVLLTPDQAAQVHARCELARVVQRAGALPQPDAALDQLLDAAVQAAAGGADLTGPVRAAAARAAELGNAPA